MPKVLLNLAMVLSCASPSVAGDGMVRVKSAHDVKTTVDRLQSALDAKGMVVFARIDHTAGAKEAGKKLRPTEVLVFGNPKVGTPLMQCQQTVAIDLPQKALVFEDANGDVWLTYNDPKYIAKRHSVRGCEEVLKKIEGALGAFSKAATSSTAANSGAPSKATKPKASKSRPGKRR